MNRSKFYMEHLRNQIYSLMIKGYTAKQISNQLEIPLRTIQKNMAKLTSQIRYELLSKREDDVLADIKLAESRFLDDKIMLRKILDNPKSSDRMLIEAIRTDAELNASLLKIGVEGSMFVKHAIQDRLGQNNVLRLGEGTSTGNKPNTDNKSGINPGVS